MNQNNQGVPAAETRRIRVLINPHSGTSWSVDDIVAAIQEAWDLPGVDLSYRLTNDAEDGRHKTRHALAEGADTVLAVGGDGMVNTIGSELINTGVALGVIPAGSGNGFARHFNIPLDPGRAARSLVRSDKHLIDVGEANGRLFFVTCSMAWDAALVRTFERFPVRGIFPYVFSAVYEFFDYHPQPFHLRIDGGESRYFPDPMVCTVANLTQYGGGALIAPKACPDDGRLELVIMQRKDWPRLLAQLPRLFAGTLDHIPEVSLYRFQRLEVLREREAAMQVDGELVDPVRDISIRVKPLGLTILKPRE